ncbi:chitin synthase export chaperone [Rhizoctonia solani AG-1 IA]|uniref:Chitin synthase export chaperone n=1 Tax=Thanatephorus cucumeris (strain AG1-IA) TaxID=983506 RepID=L8X2X0_THACA|nr:chitin synthase export chaperone [Rhizoctonia solani AG-1 IA]
MKFGSFDSMCSSAALVVCPILGEYGLEPDCYSRNVMLGDYVLFQPAVLFVHILALGMTGIMILHIRSKYTGRKEILTFFYLYSIVELLAIFLDTQIIPTANNAYPWIVAIYTGLVAATYCCLLINGFIGFQFAEDGTPLSIWVRVGPLLKCPPAKTTPRVSRGFVVLALPCGGSRSSSAFVHSKPMCQSMPEKQPYPGPEGGRGSLIQNQALGFAGFSPTQPIGLWVLHFIWPAVCVVIYVVAQLLLVMRTLQDRWPLGDIVLGTAAFVVAQVVLFGFGNTICTAYWDSITGDDLEFSVGNKAGMWEIKDEPPAFGVNKYVDNSPSMRSAPSPNGGARQSLFPDQGDARTHSLIGGVSGQNAYVGSGYVGGGTR